MNRMPISTQNQFAASHAIILLLLFCTQPVNLFQPLTPETPHDSIERTEQETDDNKHYKSSDKTGYTTSY